MQRVLDIEVKAPQRLSTAENEQFGDIVSNLQYCTIVDGIESCENIISYAYEDIECYKDRLRGKISNQEKGQWLKEIRKSKRTIKLYRMVKHQLESVFFNETTDLIV
jgi:hypothetical protein